MPVVGPILNVPAPWPVAFSVYRISRSANDLALTEMMLPRKTDVFLLLTNLIRFNCNKFLLCVLFLVFGDFSLVAGHVELRWAFASDDRQTLFRRRLVSPFVQSPVLIFGLDVEDVLHVELERLSAARTDDTGSFVDFETASSYSNDID